MRTTVTLDPDAAALVANAMRERGLTSKQAVNEAIRAGLGGAESSEGFRVAARPMGTPVVPSTRSGVRWLGGHGEQRLEPRRAIVHVRPTQGTPPAP